MKLSQDKTKVLMLTHYNFRAEDGEDTDQRIFNYLKDRVKKIALITHPFPEFGGRYSYLTIYEDRKLILDKKIFVIKGPAFLQFLHHILIIYYFLFFTGFNFTVCIALENLSFIAIFPLKLLGTIKRLIYYSIDFVPQRFPNQILNNFYHFMDKFACQHSDINWVMTKQMIPPRKKFGITVKNSSPFMIVPIAYETKNINVLPANKINLFNMIYAGALRESMGPQLAIESMPYLIKKFPNIKLTIVGMGKYEGALKNLIKELNINKHIDFIGFIPSFKKLTDTIASKSIALAPYKPTPGSFSFYSDPSKIKLYMCCGLPVITTDVTAMTKLIYKTKSGVIIDYTKDSLLKAITYLLSSKQRYEFYKNSAIKLSKKFGINYVLDATFNKIPD